MSPFNHSMALKIGAYAIDWTLGPEKKPYDAQHGYNMIHGITYLSGSTFADFPGSQGGCGVSEQGGQEPHTELQSSLPAA